MPTITDTTRTEPLGILAGSVMLRLKGTWGSGSVGIWHTTKQPTDPSITEDDWHLLDDNDGPSAVTQDKNYSAVLPAGSISFLATVAPTSVVADAVQLTP